MQIMRKNDATVAPSDIITVTLVNSMAGAHTKYRGLQKQLETHTCRRSGSSPTDSFHAFPRHVKVCLCAEHSVDHACSPGRVSGTWRMLNEVYFCTRYAWYGGTAQTFRLLLVRATLSTPYTQQRSVITSLSAGRISNAVSFMQYAHR